MIVVLRDKVQMIQQPHWLLKARMQHGPGKERGIYRLQSGHRPQSSLSKVFEDFLERTRVVIRFVRFSIRQISSSECVAACHIVVDTRHPQRLEVQQMSGMLLS